MNNNQFVRKFLVVSATLLFAGGLAAQESQPLPLSINLAPYYSYLLDQTDNTPPSLLYVYGAGSKLSLDYTLPKLPMLSFGLVGDYQYLQTQQPTMGLVTLGGGVEAGLNIKVLPILSVLASGSGGMYTAKTTSGPSDAFSISGFNFRSASPWFSAGLGLGLNLSENFSLNLAASYQANTQYDPTHPALWSLANGASFSLTANYKPAGNSPFIFDTKVPEGFTPIIKEKKGLKLIGIKSDQIFPVFKNYYDEHSVATVVLHNYDNADAENIQVSAEVKDYMNGPRDLKVSTNRLTAGGDVDVDVYTLFNDRILTVAEATKLGLTLTVKYTQSGVDHTETYDPTLQVLYRNAMTWEDDRRMAAFVSSRDPAAFGFIRGVVSSSRDARNKALSQDLQTAMVLQAALREYGMSYVKDPTSALTSNKKQVIDSLQFPQETLQSKTGDCDDLTILWCSLLESIGIETAAITVPGHILMAFAIDTTPELATNLLGSKDKFIIRDGKVWVPVETTMIADDFMKAWQEGARIVNPALQANVNFYPIHDAWKTYAPVVVSGAASSPALPSSARVSDSLKNTLNTLLVSELNPRVDKLQADIKAAANPVKPTNSLGLLYARYGQYDKAAQILTDLTSKSQYGPAFVNLGNIDLLLKKYQEASDQFGKWLNINPDDSVALAGLALAYDGLGDRKNAVASFDRLTALDSKLAAKYQYLKADASADSSRASEAGNLDSILSWKE